MSLLSDPDRRDFLKMAGFSLAALAVPGCGRAPEHEAVPFLDKPEDVTPGRSTWYATLCSACNAGCGLLARYRDGRPIKLEGNPQHPLSGGRTCAIGQAHLLSLYDTQRLRQPLVDGKPAGWEAADRRVREGLAAAVQGGRAVRLLTGTVNGPTLDAAIASFLARFPGARHVQYDALSCSALLDVHERAFGRRMLPRIRLENAEVIVAFDADFLGTWISPVEFTRGYHAGRRLDAGDAPFSRHVQVESRLSLTGCAADERHALAADLREAALVALATKVARRAGVEAPWKATTGSGLAEETLEDLARALWEAPRGRSLVLCGANRPAEQSVAAWVNDVLGNYGGSASGTTLDVETPSRQALGDDRALAELLAEIHAGRVGALVVAGANPLYDLPGADRLRESLEKIPLVVSVAGSLDETAAAAHVVAPDHHPLESWGDAEPVAGLVTVAQPVLRPLHDTRALVESLAAWSGDDATARERMRQAWRERVHPRRQDEAGFESFWNRAVHDGFVALRPSEDEGAAPDAFDASALEAPSGRPAVPEGSLGLSLYPKVTLGDGRHAHNAWLQEVPDPISKRSWDNYVVLAPETAARLGVASGDVVALASGAIEIEVPAHVQPGQPVRAAALAVGYGRLGTDRFAHVGPQWIEARPTLAAGRLLGVSAAPLVRLEGPYRVLDGQAVTLRATGKKEDVASSQLHHRLEEPAHLARRGDGPRPIAQETTLGAWRADPGAGGHAAHPVKPLWDDDHPYAGHHWLMAIDLSRCTGCTACVLACQAENNVPIVGKDEMRRQRGMHWMRIDRYFQGEGEDATAIHQPMLCQQCDNAPCESVCPVLATVHSEEGLNQQVYNRCVGTRYCSNNCPYKVRRFNWFDYKHPDPLENLVLNPDVTVRTRGVMEKCTFCVQRLQEAKAEARREGRALADGDAVPACMQVCPASAITFGDRNDKQSRVVAQASDPRSYRVLEELDVEPSVHYLRRVRNSAKEHGHG
jgi:molybdopterin-containing oxidoreductase family iron-sulfur binding subunit